MKGLLSCVTQLILLASCLCEPTSALADPALTKMIDWIREKGGFVSDKIEFATVGGVRSLMAREPVESGEVLFSLPTELMMYETRSIELLDQSSDIYHRVLGLQEADQVPYAGCLAQALLFALQRTNASFEFAPMFRTWPSHYRCPLLREPIQDFYLIADTDEVSYAGLARNRREFALALEEVIRGYPQYAYVTRDDVEWAVSMMDSRAWPTGASEDDVSAHYPGDPNYMCMFIPLADMCNHKPGSGEFNILERKRYAERAFQPGEQIHMDYFARSHTLLLVGMGFLAPSDSPHALPMTYTFTGDQNVPLHLLALSQMKRLGYTLEESTNNKGLHQTSVTFELVGDEPPLRFLRALRFLVATWDDWATRLSDDKGEYLDNASWYGVSLANEKQALVYFLEYIAEWVFYQFGSEKTQLPLEEDEKLLSTAKDLTPFQRDAITIRVMNKHIVSKVMQWGRFANQTLAHIAAEVDKQFPERDRANETHTREYENRVLYHYAAQLGLKNAQDEPLLLWSNEELDEEGVDVEVPAHPASAAR